MTKIDDLLPIPNSHEFAVLDAGRKRRILEKRAIASGTFSYKDYSQDEKPDMPNIWYYEFDAKALKRWNDTTHLSRCTTEVALKLNTAWRHQR